MVVRTHHDQLVEEFSSASGIAMGSDSCAVIINGCQCEISRTVNSYFLLTLKRQVFYLQICMIHDGVLMITRTYHCNTVLGETTLMTVKQQVSIMDLGCQLVQLLVPCCGPSVVGCG